MKAKAYSPYEKLKAFLGWWPKAWTKHQIDSPFLFDFYNNTIGRKKDDPRVEEIETIRKRLKKDNTELAVTDFGAGSFLGQSESIKTVSYIAQSAVSSRRKCTLLHHICQYYKATNILELGTSLGVSTLYLAMSQTQGKVTTVEGDSAIFQISKKYRPQWATYIESINATFETAIDDLNNENKKYNLVYIDGGHQSSLLLPLLEQLEPLISDSTILIIDDIYWSEDMTNVWKELKQSKQYNVMIDLWYFGILYIDMKQKEAIDVRILPVDITWKLGLFR